MRHRAHERKSKLPAPLSGCDPSCPLSPISLRKEYPRDDGWRSRDASLICRRRPAHQAGGRLARQAAAGDGAAFATLYDRYEQRIYNYCLRLLSSHEDAADATQDAFVKVLQRLPKLEGRELDFGAYLFTAARNASYDMIGKRKRAEPTDEIPEKAARRRCRLARPAATPSDDPSASAMLERPAGRDPEANARLPERQREVLALRELEEMSYDEIAEIMEMNRNSVAQLISRARINLRDELAAPRSPRSRPRARLRAGAAADRMRGDGQLESDAAEPPGSPATSPAATTCQVASEAMRRPASPTAPGRRSSRCGP